MLQRIAVGILVLLAASLALSGACLRMKRTDFLDLWPLKYKEILDIWLFRDKASYEKHAMSLFGGKPHTPYGYFSARHKALVMNIATGGGTLVHETPHLPSEPPSAKIRFCHTLRRTSSTGSMP